MKRNLWIALIISLAFVAGFILGDRADMFHRAEYAVVNAGSSAVYVVNKDTGYTRFYRHGKFIR